MNQAEICERISLLLGDQSLSDEQIADLLANSKEISVTLYDLWRSFPESIQRLRNYRARKKELSALSTEQLLADRRVICNRRAIAMADDPNDTELPDSFYEAPPVDSDEHILHEILKERGHS